MEKCVEVIATLNSVLLRDLNVVIDARPFVEHTNAYAEGYFLETICCLFEEKTSRPLPQTSCLSIYLFVYLFIYSFIYLLSLFVYPSFVYSFTQVH